MKMSRRILLVAVSMLTMGCGPGKPPPRTTNLTIDKSSISATVDEGTCSGLKEIGEFTVTNNNNVSYIYHIYGNSNLTIPSPTSALSINTSRTYKVLFNCANPLPTTPQNIKVDMFDPLKAIIASSTNIAVSVTAGPSTVAISLDKTKIDALFVDAACPQTMGTFTITNNNKGSVNYAVAPSTNFTVSASSFTLAQGATKTITVQYDCVVEPPFKQSIGITATAPSDSTTLKGTANASVEIDLKSELL